MSHPPRTIARCWVRRVALGLAAATVAVTLSTADPADAARRSSSSAIADQAERALDALERWHTTDDPAEYVHYVRGRDLTARLAAHDLEADADALTRAWASTDQVKQQALLAAVSQLGVPYRSLASEEGVGFDCSGLTGYAYASAGVELPRNSRDQIRAAEPVDRDRAEAGDLVYYPGHIAIYLGAEVMVHSPNSGNHVEVAHLPGKSLRFGDTVGEG